MLIHKNNSLGYNKDGVELITSLYSYLRREMFMGMRAEGKIRKIGNSLGIILPSSMLKVLKIEDGDTVMINLEEGEIKIKNPDQDKVDDEFKEKVIAILDEYFKEHGNK